MALLFARLRRAIALSSSLINHRPFSTAQTTTSFPLLMLDISSLRPGNPAIRPRSLIQSLSFRSSALSSDRRSDGGDSKIDPNEILFEGCDYNHWLITMDFPKDPKPTPEEMVETYVQTLAKVVGSVEEAKKKMYACSTTTYQGFQAVMTEEMSEKFRGLPGVVFILPDSYIDPVNKEYGGDKYDNGVITPRPPPIQYGRQGRYGDRNRNYNRPRYDRQSDSMPMQQGSPPYDRQGPMQQGRPPYDRQGPVQQGSPPYDRQGPMQQGSPPYDRQGPMQQGSPPYDRQGPMQGDGRNYAPQQNFNHAGQDRQDYGPPGARDFAPSSDRRDPGQVAYGQPGGGNNVPGGRESYQGDRRPYPSNFNQGGPGNFVPQEQRDFSQGYQGESRVSGPSGGGYRQGMGAGYGGDPRQASDPRQAGSGYGPSYTGPGERENFQQMEYQDDTRGDQRKFPHSGQRVTDEGRY